jgi:hypothetical protein
MVRSNSIFIFPLPNCFDAIKPGRPLRQQRLLRGRKLGGRRHAAL